MDACQALVVEHTDTAHPHVHVAVCRVDPDTGKACGRKNDAKKLSTRAAKYERSRGRVQVPNRIARRQAREEYRAVVDLQVAGGVPVDEAKLKARAVVPLPRCRRSAARAGRPGHRRSGRTGRRTSRPRPSRRRSRRGASGCRLARTHRRRRRRHKVLAPLTKLQLWKRAPRTTPGRTEPTTKATTARISGPDLQRLEAQISAQRDQTRDELRDAETAVRKAERGAPRQQRTFAPARPGSGSFPCRSPVVVRRVAAGGGARSRSLRYHCTVARPTTRWSVPPALSRTWNTGLSRRSASIPSCRFMLPCSRTSTP